jgi:nitroreductase/NAD-dependent dihydropyrimidine dehydrogenase PreA subunit
MKITDINQKLCTKCQLCFNECPLKLFVIEDDKQYHHDPLNNCIKCGHCVAVCPTNAVNYEINQKADSVFYKEDNFDKIDINNASKIIKNIIFKRRSIRKYKDKKVSRKDLELILEALGRSPSASNKMHRKYYIYQNEKLLNILENTVSGFFIKFLKKTFNPLVLYLQVLSTKTGKMSFNEKFQKIKESNHEFYQKLFNKEYRFFFNAPAVIIITAPEKYSSRYKMFLKPDAYIAATNGVLMTESLGLGTCWIGFAELVLNKKPETKPIFGIPKREKVLSVFTVGYPDIKYQRMAPRGPIPVKWFE